MSKREERRNRDLTSLTELRRLLKDVCDIPKAHEANHLLVAALDSQGSLANYGDAERGITPMSLNHLKVVANWALAVPDGHDPDEGDDVLGFVKLDALRRQALNAIRSAPFDLGEPPPRASKAGLATRVVELESLILELREDAFLLQMALDLRCRQARVYAEKAGRAIEELCRREQREIDLTFSLAHRSFGGKNVASLQDARLARQKK